MVLGDKPDLSLREKHKRAKEYFIDLFDRGYSGFSAHKIVSKWHGVEAADYAYEKVLGEKVK